MEQLRLLTAGGRIIYPYLEASGKTPKNANTGISAYLPQRAPQQRGAVAMHLDDTLDAYIDCGIDMIDEASIRTSSEWNQDTHGSRSEPTFHIPKRSYAAPTLQSKRA